MSQGGLVLIIQSCIRIFRVHMSGGECMHPCTELATHEILKSWDFRVAFFLGEGGRWGDVRGTRVGLLLFLFIGFLFVRHKSQPLKPMFTTFSLAILHLLLGNLGWQMRHRFPSKTTCYNLRTFCQQASLSMNGWQ